MIYVNEEKLTLGTIMMIGQDYGIENKYNMMSEDGLDKYVDDVINVLYAETDKRQEEDWYIIRENYLDEIIYKLKEELQGQNKEE